MKSYISKPRTKIDFNQIVKNTRGIIVRSENGNDIFFIKV